ncbi:response regulator transcription factor [Streptomyces sp. NPDC014892]|uniref:response regulator transcription factor n=1 Tax=Streptomyces sp. NPDC014892 TaxID=3364930 RepID=UPI0036F5A211
MRAVADGLGNEAIARRLVVSPHTVRKHLENVFRKVGADSRTAAVARIFPSL